MLPEAAVLAPSNCTAMVKKLEPADNELRLKLLSVSEILSVPEVKSENNVVKPAADNVCVIARIRLAVRRRGESEIVNSGASRHDIAAGPAGYFIIARAAVQPVVAGSAVENVIVSAAIDNIVAGAAMESVVAVAAVERVEAGGAEHRIVAVAGVDQQNLLRSAAAGLGALASTGDAVALKVLFDVGVGAAGIAREPIALVLMVLTAGTVAVPIVAAWRKKAAGRP